MPLNFVALPTALVSRIRDGAPDANGQAAERVLSDGQGLPCRHCLRDIPEGSPALLFACQPFPEQTPYAETGPVFVCADPCERYAEEGQLPPILLDRKQVMARGYDARDYICEGTGGMYPTGELENALKPVSENPDVRYMHIRSATNTCFLCRVEAA